MIFIPSSLSSTPNKLKIVELISDINGKANPPKPPSFLGESAKSFIKFLFSGTTTIISILLCSNIETFSSIEIKRFLIISKFSSL